MVIGGGSIHMAISPKNRWIFRMEVTTSRMTACTRPVRNIVMMMLGAEFARAEWLVGHADHGGQSRERPGAKAGSYFGIAPVQLAADAARALSRRQVAGAADDRWTDYGYLGAANGGRINAPHYRLRPSSHVHHSGEVPGRPMDTPSTPRSEKARPTLYF